MTRKQIVVAIGTRPEAIKLAPVVLALRQADWCRVRVLVTAQHRELLDQMLAWFGIEPDLDLDLMEPGQSLVGLTSRMLSAVDAALDDLRPDYVLVQGDTCTVMATALCCHYRGVPVGHVEAGLRTYDKREPFPEEINRQLVARLADLHFAPTEGAAANLRAEAVPADSIQVVGNTVVDALLWTTAKIEAAGRGASAGRRSILVTAHRRESFGGPLLRICAAVRRLADRGDIELLWPLHPNPEVRSPVRRELGGHPNVQLVEPLDYPAFVAAMQACHLILTDSGGVQEEAPSLGKPVLVLRERSERPEGIEAGTSLLVGTDPERIVAAVAGLLDDEARYRAMSGLPNPFGDGRSAGRIVATVGAACLDA